MNKKVAFVTGGGGFLGKEIVRQLIDKNYQVKSFSRNHYPELEKIGAEHIQGDLQSQEDVLNAAKGSDIVFHVAAKAGIWGDYKDFYNTNVLGTRNIINACQKNNIQKLVYTSSPSVVHGGGDITGQSEAELDYPLYYEAYYPQTKAIAEKEVIKANSANLATVSLRPHIIWGPGDHHFLPRIIERAQKGRLKLVDHGHAKIDTVYVDNAAYAHLLAAEKLAANSKVAGKKYFITQDEPILIVDFINLILKAAKLDPVESSIPSWLAYLVGAGMENSYKLLKIKSEPMMTKFMAKQFSTSHWFDISAAKKDLDYQAKVSLNEGMENLAQWLEKSNYLN